MATSLLPYLTTDQVSAFVELSRHGQIRAAAQQLGISEQGLRSRLLALEGQLGVELYRKYRGPRRAGVLTEQGRGFVPQALAFLEHARELCLAFEKQASVHEVRLAASQYLIRYLLIDVLAEFRKQDPGIHVRVSTMTERDVEDALLREPDVAFGLAAPYEPSPNLEYRELFAMSWSLICPPRHPLAARSRLRLEQLVDQPLILYERGSTGRQHVLDAFYAKGLSPRIALETTSTETVVSMVEAGLGVAIVPLLPTGAVTRGRKVEIRPLERAIRPIHSGVLLRRGERLSAASLRLMDFLVARFGRT